MKKYITIKQSDRWTKFLKNLQKGLTYNNVSEDGWIHQFPDGKYVIHFPKKHKMITVVPVYHDGYNSLVPKHGYRYSYYVSFART